MKKWLALLVALLLFIAPALAELGSADVTMEGVTYHLVLTDLEIVDGKLNVSVEGFGDTLRMGAGGWMLAGWAEAKYSGEDALVRAENVGGTVGGTFTFTFERGDLPTEIWMDPYDEDAPEVLIWSNGGAVSEPAAAEAPAEEPAETVIPDELVGEWQGSGTPKGGGSPIDLTATINADGTGEYTFVQSGYTESYPFYILYDEGTFSVDIPSDNVLGIDGCGGYWTLEDGKLLLDITTTFTSGREFSYTAECEKLGEESAEAPAAPEEPAAEPVEIAGWAVGDTVTFGRYEQDNDLGNGAEPIEWTVLDADGEARLLISNYGLYPMAYDKDDDIATWESSGVRAWLNSSFLNDAFSEAEQACIIESHLENPDNPEYGTKGGDDTDDFVFLLSIPELEKYFPDQDSRIIDATEYAVAQGAFVSSSNGHSWWRLRSPGKDQSYGAVVNSYGFSGGVYPDLDVLYKGEDISVGDDPLRPAIWVNPPADGALPEEEPIEEPEEEPEEESEPEPVEEPAEEPVEYANWAVGDIVTFGHYEQDGDRSNGTEPIEWIVLDAEADARLLLSKYGLYPKAYDDDDATATWETCDVRRWLNSSFLNDAFSEAEQARIIESYIDNPDNPEYGTDGGNDTIDQVFLLSIPELEKYFPDQESRIADATKYAVDADAFISSSNGHCWWRLRSPGKDQSYGAVVNSFGFSGGVYPNLDVLYEGEDISVGDDPLRPAIWMFPPADGELPEEAPVQEPEPEAYEEPAEEPAAEATTEAILDALNNDTYRATYEALLAGEVVAKGSKGDAAKGVQQTLVDFGQNISVDGNVGPKTLAALNAVQAAFGLEQTDQVDAAQYEALLPRLLISTNEPAAYGLLSGSMGEAYDYTRACALEAKGLYYSAKLAFEESLYGDWEERAAACVQSWPKTGQLYKNPAVQGSSTQLTVKFNSDENTAMLVKVYTTDDVLARTMFIGGTGKATCSLPAGHYIVKDGTGTNWYGEAEAFGDEGYYEVMTFGDGEQEIELKRNYTSTITVNVQEYNPNADSVGSYSEDWEDF